MSERKKIVVSVITDLVTDQRVIRICTTLQDMGFDVWVLARKLNDSLPLGQYNFKVHRFRCYFRKGIPQYAEFMLQLFFRLLFARTDYLLSNDLDSLPPNYLVSKWRRKHLFYDSHEYFTGVPELADSPVKRKIWKKLEDWIFPKLKTVYTVNESVRNEYQQEYGIPMMIVRNVPAIAKINAAAMPENWKGKIILLAQGAGLNQGRSCIEMINALPLLDEKFHLVFIGGGNAWDDLKKRREALHLEGRIDMLEKMPPARLKSYTLLASMGISLDSFTDKNCLFNLPNKVFDYIQAGVPVLGTAIPEVKRIVEEYQCGICIEDTSPQNISTVITRLFNSPDQYTLLRENAKKASAILNWENEKEKLEEIYGPFL